MSINDFLNQENIQMLWEVLIDEPLIKQSCNVEAKMKDLVRIFESNIRDFFLTERHNCNNLIELNKKYIVLIINYVMKITTTTNTTSSTNTTNTTSSTNTTNTTSIQNIQTFSTGNQYRKIKIHSDEPVKQAITFEEIQNDRKTLFEKELNRKQEEFTSAMTLPVPPVPNFSDNLDQPISEIELEIKRIQELRNYDIEIINNTNKNTNLKFNDNWLKPQETSIKNEKLVKLTNSNNNTPSKHITWEDEVEVEVEAEVEAEVEENESNNIFGKLKKITANSSELIYNSQNNTANRSFQPQIDEIKSEISSLNEKLDLILQKLEAI